MSIIDREILVLSIAASLDYLIGDPWGWPHPVRVMGWVCDRYSKLVIKKCKNPFWQKIAGIILGIGLVSTSALISWLIIMGANLIHPLLSITLESILLASCFALKSLRNASEDVLQPLNMGNLTLARDRLSQYVGRDTENLSEAEILRAITETVTENAVDGVMAPLFYAILGAIIPYIGSVPLAMAYKAASTLDSMVGYKEEPYTNLGWFSAKMEDMITWPPCRLTVITLALLSKKPWQVWQMCQQDAIKDPSPNSGWSEGVYAAILGIQLGGINYYRGIVKYKPLLGAAINPITPLTIEKALLLTRYSFLIWLVITIVGSVTGSFFVP